MNPTFASFLTPAGIVVAAGLITALVQLLKTVFPALDAHASGALQAFVVSAVLYAATAFSVGLSDPDSALLLIASWLACATSAVGVYASVSHVQEARSA